MRFYSLLPASIVGKYDIQHCINYFQKKNNIYVQHKTTKIEKNNIYLN